MLGAWGGGGRGGSVAVTSDADPRERLLRQAFLLRDYLTALTNYRAAGAEFKGDKAWRHFAATQEMAALCLYLTDGSRKEIDESIEKASTSFIKARSSNGDSAARSATKVVLLQLDLLRKGAGDKGAPQRMRDVAFALVGQSTEESNLCAALLLEQAALCFRCMPVKAKLRQFAFHLILAGYQYISCSQARRRGPRQGSRTTGRVVGRRVDVRAQPPAATEGAASLTANAPRPQRRHAVRAYSAALGVYAGKGWTHIEDHVHFTLGRNCSTLGKLELSIAFFLRLLRHSRQPQERQQTFMRELGSILRTHPQHALLPTLPLPRFNAKSIRVLLNDHMQVSALAPPDVLSAAHQLWTPLAAPLLPPAEREAGNWLQKSTVAAAKKTTSLCVLGEWIFVEVEIENPMHLVLTLSDLRLRCALRPAAADGKEGDELEVKQDPLEVDTQELTLPPGGRALVRLGVRPDAEGELTIEGAAWTLNGVAQGMRDFELHGRRLNKTKAERLGKVYAFNQSLVMPVIPPQPLLTASIEGAPETMMLGQRHRAEIVLANTGRTPLTNLRLRISQPAFCVVGEDSPDTSIEAAAEQAAAAVAGIGEPVLLRHERAGPSSAADTDWATLTVPLAREVLEPGESVRVPLWFRANALGPHSLHFIFCYEPTTPSPMLKRRLCPLSTKVFVQPSLVLRHFIRRARGSECNDREGVSYVLGVTLRNTSQGVRLRPPQLSCVSKTWQITPLCKTAQRPLTYLEAGEDVTVYLRLSKQTVLPAAGASSHFELSFNGQGIIDSRDVPYLSFLARDKAPKVTADGPTDDAFPSFAGSKKKEKVEPKRDEGLSLVVHWRDESGRVVGQLQLTDLQPQPPLVPAPVASAARQGERGAKEKSGAVDLTPRLPSLLCLSLEAPKRVSHGFGAAPLCTTPVTLQVYNCSNEVRHALDWRAHRMPPTLHTCAAARPADAALG